MCVIRSDLSNDHVLDVLCTLLHFTSVQLAAPISILEKKSPE